MTKPFDVTSSMRRRLFLCSSALAAITSATLSEDAFAKSKQLNLHERSLAFEHLHTGEKLRVVYWADGQYRREGIQQINNLLRDFRTDEIADIDPRLLDVLAVLSHELGSHRRFEIISAYRSPETNAMLRKHSSGVAKKSFHLQGKAIDVRLQGVSLNHLHRAAVALNAGGVGYYPRSDFIHLDTGPVRSW